MIVGIIIVLLIVTNYFVYDKLTPTKPFIPKPTMADLVLPNKEVLLTRAEVINEIEQKFVADTNDIKTVALVGIGGVEKLL
ncbi:MAG: hypothetical protein HRU35_03980 [Rickettsiaceae bacterium]|nr:hypothetical protein [Rickettsiaceae bacterium]